MLCVCAVRVVSSSRLYTRLAYIIPKMSDMAGFILLVLISQNLLHFFSICHHFVLILDFFWVKNKQINWGKKLLRLYWKISARSVSLRLGTAFAIVLFKWVVQKTWHARVNHIWHTSVTWVLNPFPP